MTKEEKDWEIGILRGIERGIQIFLQSGENTITLSVDVETAKMLAAALREYVNSPDKVPDPITGLVSCGCGGKVETHELFGEYRGTYMTDCKECATGTTQYNTEKESQDAWNTAMGYRD